MREYHLYKIVSKRETVYEVHYYPNGRLAYPLTPDSFSNRPRPQVTVYRTLREAMYFVSSVASRVAADSLRRDIEQADHASVVLPE